MWAVGYTMFEDLAPTTQLAIVAALLFIIVGSPSLYMLVDKLLSPVGLDVADSNGRPTRLGLAAHGVVFGALVSWYLTTQA